MFDGKGSPYLPDTPQFTLAVYGILKAGAIVSTIILLDAVARIEHKPNYAGVEAIIVLSGFCEQFKSMQIGGRPVAARRTQRPYSGTAAEGRGGRGQRSQDLGS